METLLEEKLHLTDLGFVQLCEELYGINRGIYNVIDSWFYKNGLYDILLRRRYTVSFLEYIKSETGIYRNGRCKFGHNGLSLWLQKYFSAFNTDRL